MITLSEQQKKAVSQINGASLIISGAGTGKSTVLAAKVAAIQDYYGEISQFLLDRQFLYKRFLDAYWIGCDHDHNIIIVNLPLEIIHAITNTLLSSFSPRDNPFKL